MAVLVGLLALLAALAQLAVLLDRTVVEPEAANAMRRVRVAAWTVVALYCLWRTFDGWILPAVLLLPIAVLALMDALAPMAKLFPDAQEDHAE